VAWTRRWALAELASMYAEVDTIAQDVQLVVSELVTNAVQADARHVSLILDGHHAYIHIATSDDAPGGPVKQQPTRGMSHGRGLLFVDALASRWGVDREEGGKTVWADVALPGHLAPTFECQV
jgi:anti-sigma regulatory factor (Ser/Thr protein kinase)